jgi:hypothetical protein
MTDDTLHMLLPILGRRAALATTNVSHPTATVAPEGVAELEVGMTRSIDKGYARRREVPALLVADVRAGLASGSMARGTTPRMASGMGMRPVQGDILPAYQVTTVTPPLGRGQAAVAWEVAEHAVMDEAG